MTKLTWLGDTDPEANSINQSGVTFVKGEAVTVPKEVAEKLKSNPLFSSDDKAEPATAVEPDPDDLAARAEEGTVKGALKAQLRSLGVTVQGNPSEDTLRAKLADALK